MTFYDRVMRMGARLTFWFAIVLLVVQLFDAVVAIGTVAQMSGQEFGPRVSYTNTIAKLLEAFSWPFLLLAASMIIDRLESAAGRGGDRA